MGKATDWKEEYRKCKEDEVYFFENYCLINGKRPGTYTVERFKRYRESVQNRRAMKMRRADWNISAFLLERVEYPLTPEEAFPQTNFLEDGPQDR